MAKYPAVYRDITNRTTATTKSAALSNLANWNTAYGTNTPKEPNKKSITREYLKYPR